MYYLVLILYKLNRHQTVVSYLVDRLCQHVVGLVCTYEYIHIHISNTYEKMKMCILPTEFHISAIVDTNMYIQIVCEEKDLTIYIVQRNTYKHYIYIFTTSV